MSENCEMLKELINDPKILVAPGVYDGFSARLVSKMGFKAAVVTGAGLSESRLGYPDVGLMGFETNLEACRAMASCVKDLPLLADGDTGYGNAINVFFVVRAFEDAGLAGIMIEDQAWPKRCGHLAGKEVISSDEMVKKVKAAVDARRNPNFIIKARTDAAGVLGIEEAINRANLYAEAGADIVHPDAVLSVDDIRNFVNHVDIPVAINMGFGIRTRSTTPLVSAAELEEMKVATVEYPRLITASAIQGMINALSVLEESIKLGKVIERQDLLVSFEELSSLMGLEEIHRLEKLYLTETQLDVKYKRKN